MAEDSYTHIVLAGAKLGGPLVFAFHGTGADEDQMVPFAREIVPGAAIVAPRGDVSENGMARFFRRTGEGVYDMGDLATRTEKMAAFVKAHVEASQPSAVYGIGYSNGANILASVVFAEPGLFDGAVLMHPLIPFQPRVNGRLDGRKIVVTAGRYDPICPPHLTSRLEAHLKAVGADVHLAWHDGGHEIRPEEVAAAKQFLTPPAPAAPEPAASAPDGISLEDGPAKGRYVLRAPGGEEAYVTFTKIGDHQIIIDHTEVPEAFRGQGVGVKLIERVVADMRATGKKIIPLCPFANAQFRRHSEWADVLKVR